MNGIAVAVLLTIMQSAPQQPAARNHDKQTYNANSSQADAGDKIQPPIVLQKPIHAQPTESTSTGKEGDSTQNAHDWIDWLNAFSTCVIALFTIVLAVGVIVQIRTARDSERAWVIVSPTVSAPPIGYIPDPGDRKSYVGRELRNVFLSSVKNTGNTPARIIEFVTKYKQVSRLQDIPAQPDYGPRQQSSDEVLLVKDDSAGGAAFLEPNVIVTWTERTKIERQESFLYAYGVVGYVDAFQRKHETRFGYIYHFPLGGDARPCSFSREFLPPSYNKAT